MTRKHKQPKVWTVVAAMMVTGAGAALVTVGGHWLVVTLVVWAATCAFLTWGNNW